MIIVKAFSFWILKSRQAENLARRGKNAGQEKDCGERGAVAAEKGKALGARGRPEEHRQRTGVNMPHLHLPPRPPKTPPAKSSMMMESFVCSCRNKK